MNWLLSVNPHKRPSARDCLQHPWLSGETAPINPEGEAMSVEVWPCWTVLIGAVSPESQGC